jgi:hypothetical protein
MWEPWQQQTQTQSCVLSGKPGISGGRQLENGKLGLLLDFATFPSRAAASNPTLFQKT